MATRYGVLGSTAGHGCPHAEGEALLVWFYKGHLQCGIMCTRTCLGCAFADDGVLGQLQLLLLPCGAVPTGFKGCVYLQGPGRHANIVGNQQSIPGLLAEQRLA